MSAAFSSKLSGAHRCHWLSSTALTQKNATSLYPLFPGTTELDQLCKIHDVLSTPSTALLQKIRKYGPDVPPKHFVFCCPLTIFAHSTYRGSGPARYDFPPKTGTGIAIMLPQVNPECVDLLVNLLAYDAETRCRKRPFFSFFF